RQARGAGDTHRREHRPDGAWRAPRQHGAGRDRHRRGEGVTPRSLTTSMDEATASFGSGLRWWRERRGFSQLDLAGAAETTQRHLSFLESGRASPSREMVLRLATVPGLSLRQAEPAPPAEPPPGGARLRAGVARERSLRAGARPGEERPRLHAGAAGAVSRLRR